MAIIFGNENDIVPDLQQKLDQVLRNEIADMYDGPKFIVERVLDELLDDREISPGERVLVAEHVKSWLRNQN